MRKTFHLHLPLIAESGSNQILRALFVGVMLSAAAPVNPVVKTAIAGNPIAPKSSAHQAQSASPSTLTVEVKSRPIEIRSADQPPWIKDWIPLFVGLASLAGALAAVWVSARNTRISIDASLQSVRQTIDASVRNADAMSIAAAKTAEAAIWQRANELEMRELQARLDVFYGPLVLLLDSVHLMAQDLRSRQPDIGKYRLLVALFDENWKQNLSPGDATLVKEIYIQDSRIEQFIRKNAQMVDVELRLYLSRAATHFRVLDLASKGELGNDVAVYQRYVYPEHLDAVLKIEMDRLKSRIAWLRANPAIQPPPIAPLNIPPEMALRPWPSPPRALLPQPDDVNTTQRA